MKEYKGIYLPDGEEHLIEWMETVSKREDSAKFFPMVDGKPTYQAHKYYAALKYCSEKRLAVDVGAHVGLWSRVMALDFDRVIGFEPMPEHADCWRRNMGHDASAYLNQCALGETSGEVRISTRTPGSSGDTGVDPDTDDNKSGHLVKLRRLDDFDLKNVDFLKIDCEGYELFVLRGAEKTLRESRPVVIVEQKPETGGFERYGIGVRDAVVYLESLGAKLRDGIQGDYILSWDK